MRGIILAVIVLILRSTTSIAQIDKSNLRLISENDLYSFPGGGTDRYYTNSLRVDYLYESQKNQPLSALLLKVSDDKKVFGWGLGQYMFTPSRIDIDSIMHNDRPYAGALFAVASLTSFDNAKKIKLTSELLLGVMGPLSLAEETQTFVHRLIKSPKPEGWKNQIPNDIIINYNVRIEKEMIYVPERLFVTGVLETYAGTMYDATGAGFTMSFGKVRSYWDNSGNKKPQFYLTFSPTIRLIYYNALLQGGILTGLTNNQDGYRLNKDQVERVSGFTELGAVLELSKFKITLLQKMRTAPFKGGNSLEYGNISISIKL